MQCMKCGREIANRQVFCEECLAEMEKYPVKPGTVVLIPPRPNLSAKRAAARRRPEHTPEERVKILNKRVRILSFWLAVTTALLVVLAGLTAHYVIDNSEEFLPGQNYSVVGNN